jgi:hypothetical protein
MTDFVLGRLKFTFKGAWTSNTAYLADDIVRYGGQSFACVTNHTSSAGNGFYNDTVKWSLVTPGTDWKGDWQVNTYYKVNDIVRYGGTVYLANVGHTSNLYTNYGLEADQSKWVVYNAGTDWKGDWQTNTYYKAKDVVKYGGIVYVANVGHTSNISVNYGLEADYSKWVTYSATPNFVGSWTANTRYKVNDVVQYGADLYMVNTPHFSNGNSIINAWRNNEANSTIFVGGLQFEDTYSSGTVYQVGDIVRYGGYNFIAIDDTQGNLPTVTAFWAVLSTGFKHQGDFNSGTAYKPGDVVRYGAGIYVAKIDTSPSTLPTVTGSWDLLSQGQRWTGDYVANVTYVPGDLVKYGGYIYSANAVSTGNAPTSNTYFKIQTTGMDWKGNWSNVTNYQLGEAVNYSNSSYISIVTSNQNNTPSATPNAWNLISQGSLDTFTTTVGDISYRSNSSGMVRLGIGTTGQVLSTDGIVPRWEDNGSTGNVYFVAPEGVDAVGYGSTKQRPFASIKYATQTATSNATIYVAAGNYFEQLPMTLKAGTALVGDNQRTVIINPKSGLADDGINQCNTTTMFFMSDASIINKVTMKGMTGWTANVTNQDNLASTMPAGVFVRLNPASPVMTKSPYVLECAAIGTGAIGALVDGAIHGAGNGNQSMIFHGFTVISSDGIGYWVRNAGRAEIVSCFTYYCKFGYATTGGGIIRSLNGNNSYGRVGAYSQGYDLGETPLVGNVYGDILTVTYSGGDFATGSYLSGATSGANAIITSNQITGNKLYIKRQTGTRFLNNEQVIGSLGGTANVTSTGNVLGQQGFIIVAKNFATIPRAGSSIQFADDTQYAYVVQSVSGTYANLESVITLVLTQDKPTRTADTAGITIRRNYSQTRLTGHDFLNIGTGNVITTNYPNTPTIPPAQGNEVVEDFPGRVYYISTDQDGNFRVGDYFRIDQATGTATLNASAFNLAGLTSLRLGSIGAQLGETINEFSSDETLSGNSNLAVPTEYAVKTYITNYVGTAAATVASNAANAIASVSVDEIPFINTVSANRTLGVNRMAFSMGTLTLSGNTIYTVSANAYHFVLNPSGFALFN